MDVFFTQVFVLLTTPPGNLVYRVIVAFSIFGALQMFAHQWQDTQNRLARRMATGLAWLLILQLLIFVAVGLGWQSLLDAHKFLPVFVWGASLLSILWMIWLWAFPEPVRSADTGTTLLSILIVAMTIFGSLWWAGQSPLLYFNGSIVDQAAGFIGMGLCLIGIGLTAIRRSSLWGLGLASMLVLFIACLVHWFFPTPESDYAGIVRLAEMTVYPLLLALPQRALNPEKEVERTTQPTMVKAERQRKEDDPKLLHTYLSLASEPDLVKFYQGLCRTYAQLMVADMCLLALPPDESNQIIIPLGYDLIMDRAIEGFSINAKQVPLLTNVLRRGRNLRLPASSNSLDLTSLAGALSVKQAGHLMAVAISPKGEAPLLSIILLSPYSNRIWSAEDQQTLIDTSLPLVGILQRAQRDAQLHQELEKAKSIVDSARVVVEEAEQVRAASAAQIEQLETELVHERRRASNLAELVEGLETKASTLDSRAGVSSVSEEAARIQGELDLALDEIVRLRAELAAGSWRLSKTMDALPGDQKAADKLEVVAAIVHELRRPIDSISGHTDLLSAELSGALSPRQQKYLERIKAAVERVLGLLDEMIDLTLFDSRVKGLNPTTVDLNEVIDEATSALIGRLSERNIALRVDLPDVLPLLSADRSSLSQILTQLLQNAGNVTPVNGEIWLRVRVERKDNERGFILVQVTDSGGGIAPQDLSRVFMRHYRDDAESTSSPTEPDTSLATVKSLVEAHGGRIWIDSELGSGATYSLLLPLPDNNPDPALRGGFSE